MDRVSKKEQNKPCLVRVFYQLGPEDKRKTDMDSKARNDTLSYNKTIVIAGDTNIDYTKSWNIQRSTWQLKTT